MLKHTNFLQYRSEFCLINSALNIPYEMKRYGVNVRDIALQPREKQRNLQIWRSPKGHQGLELFSLGSVSL